MTNESDIFISKHNEAFVHFTCSESISQELSEYFSFFVPGHEYTPLFKSGSWDGKIRLANRQNRTLPGGLVPYVQKFAADRQYRLTIDDAVLVTTNFSIAEAQAFADSLNLPHKPYEHQIITFAKSIRHRRILIVSPTASGKSLLIYLLARKLQQNHRKGLIIVPITSLVEQLFSNFKEYGWDADQYVHRLYAGKEKHVKHFLTISTWQTLHLQDPTYLKQFDFVIGDEAHLYKAKALTGILSNLTNADVRIGTTGTLDGTKTNKLVLEGHFGPEFKYVTTRQLIDEGKLADLKIKCLVLKYPQDICKVLRKSTYQEEYQAAIAYGPRAKFIRNLALSLEGNTLILFQLVEKHGKLIYDDLKVHTNKHQVLFVHGEVETEERERIRQFVETNKNSIIVASYGTFSTGINIKNIHNIIFAAPSKSRIRNLQSIGRGLRTSEGKTHVTLFDIVDDLRVGKYTNFLLRHFEFRASIYDAEKFSYKQYVIELKENHGTEE